MKWETIARANRILEREQGTIRKDWGGKLPIVLAYPNTYYVGMSSLALHTVYRLLNARPDVVCERVFWQRDPEIVSLESQRPLMEFGIVAFSISYELDYLNVVAMLRSAGIPLAAEERDEDYPLLLAGGPAVTANPEPLAGIFDAFVAGEAEEVITPLVDTLQAGLLDEREGLLAALARIPGLYVPGHSQTPVRRQWLRDLDSHPTTSVIFTPDTEFGDMYLMEISRGCRRGCRFCLAGTLYRPQRQRSVEALLAQAEEGLRHRDKLGLVGAAVSDYSPVEELVAALRRMGARISVSSLRVDPLPEPLLRALVESGTQTLTIAPEAGSQRLRDLINKRVSADDLLRAAALAARFDFAHLKLYFMIGLHTETDDDVQAITDLALAVRAHFPRQITVNVTPFVPKAHTPFQRAAMAPADVLGARLARIKKALRGQGIAVKSDSPAWAAVQGVLARGDRRVGRALMDLTRFSLAGWKRALRDSGIEAEEYLGAWPEDAALPWAVVR